MRDRAGGASVQAAQGVVAAVHPGGTSHRFRPYAEYRATGGSHFARAPAHWTPMRFGALGRLISGGTPSSERADYWTGDIPWISAKDMKVDVIEDVPDHVSGAAVRESGLRLVPAGSLVFVVRGMILAHSFPVARVTRPVTVNQDLKALVPRPGVRSEFLAYLFGGLRDLVLSMTDEAGHGTRRLRMDWWRPAHVEIPPEAEQQAIAAFLDRETARIDALVEKQERLIRRLHEHRAAAATTAILRGLPSTALVGHDITRRVAEATSGWVTRRVRQLVSFIGSGKTPLGGSESYTREGVVLIRSQNVHDDGLRLEDVAYIDNATDELMAWSRVHANDVLLNITGASIGRCALVPTTFPRANVNQHVCIVRPRVDVVDPGFLHLALSSQVVAAQIDAIENGVSREALTYSDVGNLWFPVPASVAAQRELVRETCSGFKILDATCARTQSVVARLREYRSAIISAAVTGQIDVRGEVAA